MKRIPDSIIVNTGEQERVSKTIDDFFAETIDFVEETYGAQRRDFQIKSGELADGPVHITDDTFTYLIYMDQKASKEMVLAGVLENRTEFNRVQYTFFRNLAGLKKPRQKKE